MNAKLISAAMGLVLIAAAVPTTSGTDSSTEITNEVPVVEGIALDATVTPTPGSSTTVSLTITVSDGNGYQDIAAVSFLVHRPDGTTVHVASTAATSNDDGSGTTQTYAGSFEMQFYDAPALDTDSYKVRATATDAAEATSDTFTATFHYAELAALHLGAGSISFGSLAPGERSATATLDITNHGNVRIDLMTNGTDLANGAGQYIPVDRIGYDLAHANMTGETALTATPFTNTGFDLATGPSVTQTTYWAVTVPAGSERYMPAADYLGTLTFAAVAG
jgi:hypothetical protein